MASYSSFHGRKMHGLKPMLTDVLVGRMGFDGFVIGDWNGHGQVQGCTNDSCAASFNAGLDMFMVPEDWEALYRNTLKQVQSGEISQARLDEAVARILRVKVHAGVLDAPKPSARKNAGNWALLGAPEHRAIAREAVRKSLVLLKNENSILPLPRQPMCWSPVTAQTISENKVAAGPCHGREPATPTSTSPMQRRFSPEYRKRSRPQAEQRH